MPTAAPAAHPRPGPKTVRCGYLNAVHGGHHDFAAEGQVDGPSRIGRGNLRAAGDELTERVGARQLVVPFDVTANDAGLVQLVLVPLDGPIARAWSLAVDGVRRAAGDDDHAALPALSVVQVAAEVLRPGVDVDQHGLRTARHIEVAMGGGQRDVLVQTGNDGRHRVPVATQGDDGFLHGRGVRAGIEEEILDAVRDERLNGGLGAIAGRQVKPPVSLAFNQRGYANAGYGGATDRPNR